MKPRKIKRRPTYRRRNPYRRRAPIGKILGTVLACVVLAALGLLTGKWLLNGPQRGPETELPSSTTASSNTTASSTTTTLPQVDLPPQQRLADLRAVYLPPSALQDTDAFRKTVAAAKEAGCNGVVLELKDSVGRVYFQAEGERVKQAGAVSSSAVSKEQLKALLAICEEQEMRAVGYLFAFHDRTYRSLDAIIEYYSEGSMTEWLDNVPGKGKTWLNPYKPAARSYLVELGKELQEVGFTALIYDGVQFPFQRQAAFFDSSLTNQLKPEITALQTFVSEAKAALSGVELSFCCAGDSATGSNTAVYGSDNPLKLGAELISPMLAQSGAKEMLEKIRFRADELGENAPALLPWLDVSGLNAAQIKTALKAVDGGPVVVYAANGTYDFAALKG